MTMPSFSSTNRALDCANKGVTPHLSTEGLFLSSLGMDTVVLGPGDISVAHQPDEHRDPATVEPTLALPCGLVERFCVTPAA